MFCVQNDPNKTICATSFIVSVIQHVKIGDISMHQSGFALSGDAPSEDLMEPDNDETRLPEGFGMSPFVALSREEENALVRESTSGFAGTWSIFFQVLEDSTLQIGWRLFSGAFLLCTRIFQKKEAERRRQEVRPRR